MPSDTAKRAFVKLEFRFERLTVTTEYYRHFDQCFQPSEQRNNELIPIAIPSHSNNKIYSLRQYNVDPSAATW